MILIQKWLKIWNRHGSVVKSRSSQMSIHKDPAIQVRMALPCVPVPTFFVKNASRARTRVQWEKCTCGNLSLNLENTLKSRTRSCARVTLAPLQWDGKEKERNHWLLVASARLTIKITVSNNVDGDDSDSETVYISWALEEMRVGNLNSHLELFQL